MDGATVAAWITGIGSILAAGWGVVLIVREVRSRQSREIRRLDEELQWTQEQLIANHRYAYELRATLADHGIDTPVPPPVEPVAALAPPVRDHRRGSRDSDPGPG